MRGNSARDVARASASLATGTTGRVSSGSLTDATSGLAGEPVRQPPPDAGSIDRQAESWVTEDDRDG